MKRSKYDVNDIDLIMEAYGEVDFVNDPIVREMRDTCFDILNREGIKDSEKEKYLNALITNIDNVLNDWDNDGYPDEIESESY